jgi:hypothetical protein
MNNPRYEFRVWGDDLRHLREKLALFGAAEQPSRSDENYLISIATDNCNAKIRSGVIDIKVLVNEYKTLEQWKPVLKASFPVESSNITGQVFPSLALSAPVPSKAKYEMDEFLDEVVRIDNRIALVNVAKARNRFKAMECMAEFADVLIEGVARHTVAVESMDPEAVLPLATHLGIAGGVNTSYVREIKRVLEISRR